MELRDYTRPQREMEPNLMWTSHFSFNLSVERKKERRGESKNYTGLLSWRGWADQKCTGSLKYNEGSTSVLLWSREFFPPPLPRGIIRTRTVLFVWSPNESSSLVSCPAAIFFFSTQTQCIFAFFATTILSQQNSNETKVTLHESVLSIPFWAPTLLSFVFQPLKSFSRVSQSSLHQSSLCFLRHDFQGQFMSIELYYWEWI